MVLDTKKRIKCNHCSNEVLVESIGLVRCECGKVVCSNGNIIEGTINEDYIDITKFLLNE